MLLRCTVFLLLWFCAWSSHAYLLHSDKSVELNSPDGRNLLDSTKYKEDFYQVLQNFEAQSHPAFCAVASSVIVLNALRSGRDFYPGLKKTSFYIGKKKFKHERYFQSLFLNRRTDAIKPRSSVLSLKDAGFNLWQITKILRKVYKLSVYVVRAKPKSRLGLAKFRIGLKKYLSDKTHFILANFQRSGLHFVKKATNELAKGGHFSPIVAYNPKKDMVLVAEVNATKFPWYWVSVRDLYNAMATKDGAKFRGYLVISDKKAPSRTARVL